MSQQSFDFIDDEPAPHQIELDSERRQSLVKLMSTVVIHVLHSEEKESDEQSQKE